MGLFDSLLDKREKMDYCRGCDFLFNICLRQTFQDNAEFSDISETEYRANIVGIVAAYLDTKPIEKRVRVRSTFGKDALYYGTVNGTMLVETHPIQANLKTIFLPKVQEKHSYYSEFMRTEMNNHINATTTRTLANEVLLINGIDPDSARINAITVDINAIIEMIDAMLSKYKFV